MVTEREGDDAKRALRRMVRKYEADYSGERPRLRRRRSHSTDRRKKSRRRRWTYGVIMVLIAAGFAAWYGWPQFAEYESHLRQRFRSAYDYVTESAEKFWEELQEIDGLLPDSRDDKRMYCSTAIRCAIWIKNQYQAELDASNTDFHAVRARGTVVTVEYWMDMVRADYSASMIEDGRTLDKWADQEIVAELRRDACGDLDHSDFINMGGTMIHDYRFADGKPFRKVVIDNCP